MRIDTFIKNRKSSLGTLPFRIKFADGTVWAKGKRIDPETFEERYKTQIQQAKEQGTIIGVNFTQPEPCD